VSLFLVLLSVSLVLAGGIVWRARRVGPRPAISSLFLGGGAFLLAWLAQSALRLLAIAPEAGDTSAVALHGLQAAVAGTLALPLWVALMRLSLYRVRGRDLVWILPFGLLSIGLRLLAPDAPAGIAELLALPALARYRWHRDLGPGARGLTSLFGFLFILLNLIPSRLSLPDGGGGALHGLMIYHDWVRGLATVYLVGALPRLLWGMELPIRSVRRRLLASHLLAGVVPLILIALFWGLSTYLSVSGERARIAARYFASSAEDACRVLERAEGIRPAAGAAQLREDGRGAAGLPADGPGPGAAVADSPLAADAPAGVAPGGPVDSGAAVRLAEWARLQEGVWPGLRVWHRRADGVLARVHGAAVPGERNLDLWSRERLRTGIIILAGQSYVGAACFRPEDEENFDLVGPLPPEGPAAVALAPVEDFLGPGFERKFDAVARLETGFLIRPEGGFTIALPDTSNRSPDGDAGVPQASQTSLGAALLPGIEWSGGSWHDRQVLLWVHVGFLPAIRGLAQNLRENPFNLFSLIFLAVVAGLFVLVELLTIGMVVTMGRSILRALSALRQGTARLRSGNFRYRIPIESADELWEVADSFNEMAADLDKARDLEIEKERLEGELDVARQIQSRLLPAELPRVPRYEQAGCSVPARHVGGDYYDVLKLRNGRVALVAADVSGKGVPAALLMSSFRASLHSIDLDTEGPARTLGRMNAFVHASVEPGRFVTAFLAVLHPESGRLVFANAGHNPPVLLRADGSLHLLRDGGLVIGLFGDTAYDQAETTIEPGDLLVLYTDGVTEAADEEDDLYGEERLFDLLQRLRTEPCHEIMAEILGEVRAFSGGGQQSDDITLLLVRRKG